jgi:hypothetical protein
MDYEKFKTVVETLENVKDLNIAAYDIGVNLMDYSDNYHKIITILLASVFDAEGIGWIEWYLYERKSHNGSILTAEDGEGNMICHNIDSLWDTVKNYMH